MYKLLIRTPLEQAMLLVGLLGLIRLVQWPMHGHPNWSWVVAAGLGAGVFALIAGRLRKPQWLPLAIVLGLGAILAAVDQMGFGSVVVFTTATAGYGLLLWLTMIHSLSHLRFIALLRFLGLSGGYGEGGGRQAVEQVVHWSAFVLILLSLAVSAGIHSTPGVIPTIPWSVLVLSFIFFWLAGKRYQKQQYSYLVIALFVWGVIGTYAWLAIQQQSWLTGGPSVYDPTLAPILVSCAVGFLGVSELICRSSNLRFIAENGLAAALYALPLRISAVVLAGLMTAHILALLAMKLLVSPAWGGLMTIAITSAVMLLANRVLARKSLSLLGALLAILTIIWGYTAIVHGNSAIGLWPGRPEYADQWLVLALTSLLLSTVAHLIRRYPSAVELYSHPFFQVAWLTYIWTLIGALMLFTQSQPTIAWIFAGLIGGLFPLLRPIENSAQLRGVGIALLATLCVAALLGADGALHLSPWIVFSWAYSLWAIGNLVLPRFNVHFPQWAVAPEVWPWLGLLVLSGGLAGAFTTHSMALALSWSIILVIAGYLFLMLRNSAWQGFPWLVVLAFTWAGIAFSVSHNIEHWQAFDIGGIGGMAIETLVLANLLLLGVPLWRRFGPMLTRVLNLQQSELQIPLLVAALGLCVVWLAALGIWDILLILFPAAYPSYHGLAVVLGLVLTLSFAHVLKYWPTLLSTHLLVVSTFLTVLAAWGGMLVFHLPLALALWGGVLITLSRPANRQKDSLWQQLQVALMPWLRAMPLGALVALVLVNKISLLEELVTLTLVIAMAVIFGWRYSSRLWYIGAAAVMVILFHRVWFLWISWDDASRLLSWYALQFTLMTWGLRRLIALHQGRKAFEDAKQAERLTAVTQVLVLITPWIGVLALVEWVLHGLMTIDLLLFGKVPQGLGGAWSALAALMAALGLIGLGIQQARLTQRHRWIYGVALMITLTGLYCRLQWVGLAPVTVWDTAAIITAAYALFIVQRLTLSQPMLHLTMLAPLFALATVPFQLGSVHAGLTLLAAGTLYLLARRATGMGTPMYLGILALNVSVYLWVPGWVERYGLWQVYLIPVAISVLWLLHAHRHELKPNVLNGARLGALSILYVAATMDVFLQESLGVFVLALALSITGIIAGIALRTRAFLYAGTTFLVLNVLGQVVQLYPEQRLGRALVLMAVGAGITGLMIWFNIKRELLMQRIRIFRADLETWD